MNFSDSIFALATAPGKSGIAVIRLSGPQAIGVLTILTGIEQPRPNEARYAVIRHPGTGHVIDRGLALYFKAPHSFTGEDTIEFQIHGSFAVIEELLSVLSQFTELRPAEPGEFSKRAFINGKMDLIEAEGLADLIDATSGQQKSQAMRQMEGELSRYYEELRTRTLTALAHLEAYIDFPDEDIPESVITGLSQDISRIKSTIRAALADDRRGEALRGGLNVVILGAPNAGKSSILNILAKKEAAIVSHIPGTTRDVIEVQLDMGGFPVVLIDTAGLRDSSDDIEAEGIRRAKARAEEADIKLVLLDAGLLPHIDANSRALIDEKALLVLNKADLLQQWTGLPDNAVLVSAATGQGMEKLWAALNERVRQFFNEGDAPMITRNRHRASLLDAYRHLEAFGTQEALELACEELRQAALSIGKITGKIEVDDVLEVIFKQFCIGK